MISSLANTLWEDVLLEGRLLRSLSFAGVWSITRISPSAEREEGSCDIESKEEGGKGHRWLGKETRSKLVRCMGLVNDELTVCWSSINTRHVEDE